jgi:hypothetical protein
MSRAYLQKLTSIYNKSSQIAKYFLALLESRQQLPGHDQINELISPEQTDQSP